jgi:hypothetical protein
MNILVLWVTLLFLGGCASSASRTGSFDYLSNENNDALKQRLAAGEDVNKRDETGQTPLHFAIRYAPNTVNDLLAAGANVNAQDHKGITPMHVAVLYRKSMIEPLLLKGADIALTTTEFVYCNNKFGKRKMARMKVNAQQLAWNCNKYKALSEFERFEKDTTSWNQSKQAHSKVAYQDYLKLYPKGIFSLQARLAVAEIEKQAIANLKAQKKCAMSSMEWVFIEGSCKDKLAHGQGVAVTLEGDRLEGEFKKGMFTYGQYFESEEMVYEGPYEDDLPHGLGICFFEGAFEECKQYKGQRIDALYKQRQYMRAELGSMKKELARLKQAVYSNVKSDSASSSKYSYLADLNSKDDVKRTVSQVRAAVDLYKTLK